MRPWLQLLRRLASEQKGTSAVEYGLIIAMIVLAMFTALQAVGSQTASMWNNVSSKVVTSR